MTAVLPLCNGSGADSDLLRALPQPLLCHFGHIFIRSTSSIFLHQLATLRVLTQQLAQLQCGSRACHAHIENALLFLL